MITKVKFRKITMNNPMTFPKQVRKQNVHGNTQIGQEKQNQVAG